MSKTRMASVVIGAIAVAVAMLWAPSGQAKMVGASTESPGGGTPGTARNVKLVGHEPLFGRGMNSALTFYGRHAYVSNRSDGSAGHEQPGIQVVDVREPADPEVVGSFGEKYVTGENVGQTSREMRVWPEKGLLAVTYFRCSTKLHDCASSEDTYRIRFFDVAANPVDPPLLSTYIPSEKPHEVYLWVDPQDSDRALLWMSTPTSSTDPDRASMVVTDISRAREGVFREVATGNWNQLYPGAEDSANYDGRLRLHSMTPTADGRRTYLAYQRGHMLVLDTSDVADGVAPGETVDLDDDLLTPVENRPRWGTSDSNCAKACAESHSAVPLPGRPFALTTDEVYGTYNRPSNGCPWGWSRMIDVGRPEQPRIVGEYKIRQNQLSYCAEADPAEDAFNSYASHNPTLTRNLAMISWHSGGLQVVDTSDPGAPRQAGWFSPEPLGSVATEDPALSTGPNKVVMWSFPIVRDGLIYVVDIRNGLYVLRYTGPRAREVDQLTFLEGNSNLGDANALATTVRR